MYTYTKETITFGSVCSGLETPSVAWVDLPFKSQWAAEIEPFPCRLLAQKYPHLNNVGNMVEVPTYLEQGSIPTVDLFCGGTPCQPFSTTGLRKGLQDERGLLTLKFIEIANMNDALRAKKGQSPAYVLWENVPGVLSDKSNAFGQFISGLAGLSEPVTVKKWATAGVLRGRTRNVAWRVLDAQYFGIPQQRKRLFVLACGKEYNPEDILLEKGAAVSNEPKTFPTERVEGDEVLKSLHPQTDCLLASYGRSWNGNSAAYTGSLFAVQNNSLRRLTVLECERLMGFPDHYTDIPYASDTARYKALGNAWAVPVIRWLGERLIQSKDLAGQVQQVLAASSKEGRAAGAGEYELYNLLTEMDSVNVSKIPNTPSYTNLLDLLTTAAPAKLYLSDMAKKGILHRAGKQGVNIHPNLLPYLLVSEKGI